MNFRNSALTCLTIVLACTSTYGQDGPPPPNERTTRTKNVSKPVDSQPLQQFRHTGSRRNFGHLAEQPGLVYVTSANQLLKYKAVRRELEMVEHQEQELADFRRTQAKLRRERLRALANSGPEKMLEESENSLADKPASPELLPDQQERLEQIHLQLKIQSNGIYATLVESDVAERLEISEEQQEELRKAAFKHAKEYEAKLAELKKEFRENVVSELSQSQQRDLKALHGDEFNINANPDDDYE